MRTLSRAIARPAHFLLAVLLLTWHSPLAAQTPNSIPSSQRTATDPTASASPGIRVFAEKEGVRAGSVPTLGFDSFGRLWIGTEVGPACYSGKEWTSIQLPDAQASSWVTALTSGEGDSLWFGTRTNGVWRYHNGAFEHHNSKSGLPSDRILSLAQAGSGETSVLWVGTEKGVARLRNGTWTTYSSKNSPLPEDNVTVLAPSKSPTSSEAVWIGTRGGLARLDADQWTVYRTGPGSLPDYEIAALLETQAPNGQSILWVATRAGGLAQFQDGTWTTYNTTNSAIPSDQVWSLAETRDALDKPSLWVGTYGAGLARWQDGVWTKFDNRNSDLPNNYILSLRTAPTRTGASTLWAGTAGGGVVRIRLGGWKSLTAKHDNLTGEVWSFAETGATSANPAFWMSGQGGVHRFDQGKWAHFTSRNSALPNDFVPALLESTSSDPPGALWAATQGGLARFAQGTWQLVASKGNGLPADGLRCLLETRASDGKPVLWVGTSLGLARYLAGAWTTFNTDNSGIGSNAVMSLVETPSPTAGPSVWIGTMGGGLSRYQDDKWTTYSTANSSLPSNEVMSLSEIRSSSGQRWLWVGTGSAGVARFNPNQPSAPWFTLSTRSQPPLPDDVVYRATQDRAGRVYLLTNRGVARLTQTDQTRDDNSAWKVETFGKDDGLPSNEGNARASFVDHIGRIWMGTVGGAAVFDPSLESPPTQPHTLLLHGGQLANTDRFLLAGQELTWKQNTISFDYALLNLFREFETRYRTQLVGFDSAPSEWTPDGKSRYTNLSAGSYEFQVWGRDYAGNVTGPVTLPFRVRPAPWRTIWAYSAYAFGILAVGYAIVRARLRALQRRTEVLEARVRQRTAELHDKNAELDSKNVELADHLQKLQIAQQESSRKNTELAKVNKELLESNYRADRIFSALADALPGTVLDGKYRLDSRIGSGGFAVVFKGTQLALNRPVAIKVFRPTAGNDSPRELERFRREAISSCRVEHPNAIQVFDSTISEDSIAYMVMELLQGKTLAAQLKEVPTLSLRRCVEIVAPVCRALAKAHEAGIVHRDIKPANVFLHQSPEGEIVKLVDFGIAKVLGADEQVDSTLTNTGSLLGTPLYMAPERFRSKVCDARSDVYSVGVMLYRMIAGTLPFEGDVCELVIKQVIEEPRHLGDAAPHVPRAIADLVMTALSKNVDLRPSAQALGSTLQQLVDSLPKQDSEAVGLAPERPPQDAMTEISDTARDRLEPTPSTR